MKNHRMKELTKEEIQLAIEFSGAMTRATQDLNAFHNVHADFFFYSPKKINEMYESNANISEDDLEFIAKFNPLAKKQQISF